MQRRSGTRGSLGQDMGWFTLPGKKGDSRRRGSWGWPTDPEYALHWGAIPGKFQMVKDTPFTRHCEPSQVTEEPIASESRFGQVPDWLSGVLYRTGPGVQKFGEEQYKHAFDAIAILHAFEIRDGDAKYRSRVLEGTSFQKNLAGNRIAVTEFGTVATPDPCSTLLGRFMNRFMKIPDLLDSTDNGTVNMFFRGDELYATSETNNIRRVDPRTLKTIGDQTRYSNSVAVHRATAHPHSDADGSLYNLGESIAPGQKFHCIVKFPIPSHPPAEGTDGSTLQEASIVAKVPSRSSWDLPYFHSFGMSENYFIFAESPMTINMRRGLFSGVTQSPPENFFEWDPNGTSTFILVKRDTGEVYPIRYDSRPFACFHHINAYEEDNQVVVDICVADGTMYKTLYIDALRDGTANVPVSEPIRFILPLSIPEGAKSGDNLVTLKDTKCTAKMETSSLLKVTEEKISGPNMEMPRINYSFNSKKYRFFYSVGIDSRSLTFHKLMKVDSQSKAIVGTYEEEGIWVSEPVFVERPNADEEDDGVVLSLLTKKDNPLYAGLLVLDGKTFELLAKFDFRAEGNVTGTLHGIFNPNQMAEPVFQ
eukprot:maker-scaffold386_size188734-snap-gene-0.22 protein:Tk02424 transcript:maker-scaffold386_size188734-snap-gene-0.22-mRNA-1 annotation:"-carotene -monooxygenase-like"